MPSRAETPLRIFLVTATGFGLVGCHPAIRPVYPAQPDSAPTPTPSPTPECKQIPFSREDITGRLPGRTIITFNCSGKLDYQEQYMRWSNIGGGCAGSGCNGVSSFYVDRSNFYVDGGHLYRLRRVFAADFGWKSEDGFVPEITGEAEMVLGNQVLAHGDFVVLWKDENGVPRASMVIQDGKPTFESYDPPRGRSSGGRTPQDNSAYCLAFRALGGNNYPLSSDYGRCKSR